VNRAFASRCAGLLLALAVLSHPSLLSAREAEPPPEVAKALARAGDNRPQLVKALRDVPAGQRKGMAFLIANMPDEDLRTLSAAFLLENVDLAYRARKSVPWGKAIPEDVFLNDVLPYANLDEGRDPWRKKLFELCLPLVKDCKTPGEAAQRLNREVFKTLKVRYSTRRKKPHQSPRESIAQGMASCTGLSILLSDACRSVAVPARVVGTPRWVSVPGNHTWVEVWDRGWHFTGACEPDPKGLDRAWFTGRAARAKKDSPRHAIYAASFRRTGLPFPRVWAPGEKDVPAENVTDRYTALASPKEKEPLSREQTARITEAVADYFRAAPDKRAAWKFDPNLDRWLAEHEEAVRRLVWQAYRAAPIHAEAKKDFDNKVVRNGEHVSPYTVKEVGKRPKAGWPLFIAMHGGGGVPKRVNDSQWRVMQRYYKDQPSVTGYKYLALRAPNDRWNGFYDTYVPPLVVNLIRQFLLFGDVDPDKVYLMGYSHGGYGAFFIGPKVPDRFAAVHASAAAPTDGTISPKTLRNTRFTFMIGENDTRYGRRKRCEAFAEAIAKLKASHVDAFPVEMEFKKGHGHTGLPDRDKIKEMYAHTRNPVPKHLTWDLTDAVIGHFYWLSVPEPGAGKSVEAVLDGNALAVTMRGVKACTLWLDGRLIDMGKPLEVTLNGKRRTVEVRPRLADLCRCLVERGDPRLAFTARVVLESDK
jgi:predicted esterase